jgi:hypothetical protein
MNDIRNDHFSIRSLIPLMNPCQGSFVLPFSLCGLPAGVTLARDLQPPFPTEIKIGFAFGMTDKEPQRLYDAAMMKMKGNLVQFTPSIKVFVDRDRVCWSGLADGGHDFTCSQRWGDTTWVLQCKDGQLRAIVKGEESFTASAGARIVTGLDGKLIKLLGIDPQRNQVTVKNQTNQWKLTVEPNQGYCLDQQEIP